MCYIVQLPFRNVQHSWSIFVIHDGLIFPYFEVYRILQWIPQRQNQISTISSGNFQYIFNLLSSKRAYPAAPNSLFQGCQCNIFGTCSHIIFIIWNQQILLIYTNYYIGCGLFSIPGIASGSDVSCPPYIGKNFFPYSAVHSNNIVQRLQVPCWRGQSSGI